MKWAGMYFLGFALLIGGVLAALWKLGILQNIDTTWIVIGVVILAGVGIMVSIANSGVKQNIEIDQEQGTRRSAPYFFTWPKILRIASARMFLEYGFVI